MEKVTAVENEDDTTKAKARESRKANPNPNPKARTSARKARTRAKLTINNAVYVESTDVGAESVQTEWCSR